MHFIAATPLQIAIKYESYELSLQGKLDLKISSQ
jgi:hypothetical protein